MLYPLSYEGSPSWYVGAASSMHRVVPNLLRPMTTSFYEPLSYLDASFLALESPSSHMHVAGVALYEAGPLKLPDGGIDIERIKSHINSKLQYIPRYRQRLAYVPVTRHPVWIDDEHFTFDYHVRHTSLPKPGDDEQLKRLAGRIVSQQLDRGKPLWELWVVEGLENDRFALVAKIHHCMIDGVSGVDLTTILLNLQPTPVIEPTPDWHPRPHPTESELAVSQTAKSLRRAIDTLTHAGKLVREGKLITETTLRKARAVSYSLRSGWLSTAAHTPLNDEIGSNRRFDWTQTNLNDIKDLRKATGSSVNDVVLAIVAGAVRSFLQNHRDFDVTDVDFRIMNPVSTRSADQRGSLGNQVAMWLVSMPIDESDPLKRLRLIQDETTRLKKTDQALGAATLVDLSRGTPLTVLSLASRWAGRAIRPFNMTVTNVPGPQFPLYLLEARMLASIPIVPLWAHHGVGIALFSYDGTLLWGIHSDYDALPDSDHLIAAIHDSLSELKAAASI